MQASDDTPHRVAVYRADGVVTLQLSRPAVRNALDKVTWLELSAALSTAADDGSVRALVLTGGDSFFSAGGDVDSMPRPGPDITSPSERLSVAHTVLRQIAEHPAPVIAAVERYAIGAAWGLVLGCDLVVAGTGAFFQAPFAMRGLVADSATAWHLPNRIGYQRSMRYLLTGERMSAESAYQLGLVSHVAPDGEATSTATTLAHSLASGPSESNALTKSLARRSAAVHLADYLELERLAFALAAHGRNAREGLDAFTERREPRYL